ncbi:hypothetical protein GE061_001909 [Apolygus lucorum]|uniref:Uncharacterized protein n=1 Tax=Apolygus lucorum TaxID=248454 RepID=A0A6A4J830_APOLU|nr:hypothetical protein GE061_001909 [Apolygus lucorum]
MSRRAFVLDRRRGKHSSGARQSNFFTSMGSLTKYFGLAMMGNAHMMELAVQQSLDHWNLTNNFDIVLMVLKLLKVCHTNREDLVLEVFDVVYEKTGCFDILFDDVIFGTCLYPSKERLEEIEWYLKVASGRTFTFQNEDVPMIDLPNVGWTLAAHAASKGRTIVLLLFLRYGADPNKAAALLTSSPFPEEVLRLILRAMPYPAPNVLKIEPTLVLVPRLKHLCKTVVRNVLIKNIPDAIYDLPIPFELKEYLDLLKDF